MFFEKWMTKALGVITALLAVLGFVKLSNKNAADARENEVNLNSVNDTLKNIKVKQDVQDEVSSGPDDDAVKRLLDQPHK